MRSWLGITEGAIEWIQSYLHDRTQKVVVNGKESSPHLLECCVPQGSFLGPLFYSDYTRPLGHLLHSLGFQFHLYADDSQLTTSEPGGTPTDQSIVIYLVQNGVKRKGKWMKQNKLKLNEEKTEFIVFGTRRQLKKLKINSILLGGYTILRSYTARNLGVIMDQYLDMSYHVASVCKLCYHHLRSMWKIHQFLTKEATQPWFMQRLFQSWITALLYGINQYLIAKLQRVQNAAGRLIM